MNYTVTKFPEDLIKDVLRNKEDILTKGNINDASGLTKRNSSVSWIKDKTICQRVFSVIKNKTEDLPEESVEGLGQMLSQEEPQEPPMGLMSRRV